MRRIATDGVAWSGCLCLCVRNGDNLLQNWLNRSRCRLARIVPHNHVLHGCLDPPSGKGNFGGEQTWACPGSLQSGMDLWGDDAAFCQITFTSCYIWHTLCWVNVHMTVIYLPTSPTYCHMERTVPEYHWWCGRSTNGGKDLEPAWRKMEDTLNICWNNWTWSRLVVQLNLLCFRLCNNNLLSLHLSLCTWLISQGSVATVSRWGGWINNGFVAHYFSVLCAKYYRNLSTFVETTVIWKRWAFFGNSVDLRRLCHCSWRMKMA